MTPHSNLTCAACGKEFSSQIFETELCPDCRPAPQTERTADRTTGFQPSDWSFAEALALWAFFTIAPAILSTIAILIYGQIKGIGLNEIGRGIDALIIGVVILFLVHVSTLMVGWRIVTGGAKRPFFQTLGWRWHPRFKFHHVLGVVAAMYLAMFLLSHIIPGGQTDFDRMLETSTVVRVSVVALAIVTAPLVEELVYRGVLYPAILARGGRARAVIIVALMFAVAHYTQYAGSYLILVAVTMLSFVITLIRSYTGQLLPCVVTHLVYNGIGAALILSGYGF